MISAHTIVADHTRGDPLAWHETRLVSRDAFLSDVERIASELPDRRFVINQCSRRYPFLVAFVAAIARGQTTLMPPDSTPRTRRLLESHYEDPYTLTDLPEEAGAQRTLRIDPRGSRGDDNVRSPTVDAQRTVAVVFTSGTTGEPVEHSKTWGALHTCAELYTEELELPAGASIVATVPPQHMYGLESSVLVPLCAGRVVHSMCPSFPADVRAALADVSVPRILVTTPVHLRALVGSRSALPEVALIVSAAAPLSQSLARAAAERFGAELTEVYGCTEAGILATRRPLLRDAWKLARAIDVRRESEGYSAYGAHIGTVRLHDRIEPLSAREFLLHGRDADMVNVAGKRASLAGLDSILLGIEGVEDGAFFVGGDDHGEREMRLSAVVVAPNLSASGLKNELRSRVDSAFVPREVYVVRALPRNSRGKLTREALLQVAAAARSDQT